MSIEHSVICDRCGSLVAAASTVDLSRADAAQLGARQDVGEDLCARCSTSGGSIPGQRPGDQQGAPAAQTSAASSPTRRLADGLVELLDELVREAFDSRIAQLSRSGSGPTDGEPGSPARAFAERMSR